ncbi:MAG: VCBS domain-containing protein, partial [Alphaproteobacteria bacterium]|nr:VCBS domain-containing protein [Alphaproteobacteria bacterium]
YTADKDAADPLTPGETVQDTFIYRLTDSAGLTDEAILAITVHGVGNETYDIELVIDENADLNFQESTFPELEGDEHNPPIIIQTLPERGTLFYQGSELTAVPQEVPHANLNQLMFRPDTDTHGDDGLNNQPGYAFFTYSIDLSGDNDPVVTVNIDVTPDGNNSPPTITDPTTVTASIAEIADGATGETTVDVTASGYFEIDDGDNDAVTVSQTNAVSTHSGGSVLGTLTIGSITNNTDDDGAGQIDWSYAINDSHLDAMAVGDSFTETFTLTVDDGNGGTVTQDIVITVNGTNDAPVANDDGGAIGEGQTLNVADGQGDNYTVPVSANTTTGDVIHTAAANFADTDIDGDALRVSAIAPDGGATATIQQDGNVQVNGVHGVLTMYAHGGYDYTANGNVTEAGATETDSFTYTVSDDNGGTTTANLQITITDVPNNPPTIEAQTSVTGSVTELDDPDATEDTASLTANGSFTIADLENDGVSVSVAEAGTTREGGGFLGALTATVDNDTDGDGSGEIGWSYTIANGDIGGLDIGQNFSETFTITVTDTNNGAVTQDVTVTVNGANDVPDIQNDSYSVSFGNTLARDAANGVLGNDSDDDDQDVLIVDAAAVSAVDFNTVASGADMTDLVGTYGSLTIDTDGSFTYTPDANNVALQALDGAETVTETFYIDVHDGNATNIGAGGRNVNQLDIVISGVNDAPVAVDDVISVTVGTPATGNIIDPDVNADGEAGEDSDADGDALTVTQYQTNGGDAGTLGQALQGVYGTLLISADGSYTYTVDEANADVIAWGPGDTPLTETFNYTITDPASETASAVISVNVSGVNDEPEADPIVETRTKLDAEFSVDLVTDANATDIDDGDVLVAINDGDLSDDEPIATFTRTGTTRVMVTADSGLYL